MHLEGPTWLYIHRRSALFYARLTVPNCCRKRWKVFADRRWIGLTLNWSLLTTAQRTIRGKLLSFLNDVFLFVTHIRPMPGSPLLKITAFTVPRPRFFYFSMTMMFAARVYSRNT